MPVPETHPAAETEFFQILREIVAQKWTAHQWAEHEADDWFQTKHFCGGFEANETYQNGTFNFSYYDQHRKEWWFTFLLDEVEALQASGFQTVSLIDPETFDFNSINDAPA